MKDLIKILPICIVSRLLIFLAIICSYSIELKPVPARGEKGIIYDSEIKLDREAVKKAINNVFSSADAGWYSDIAETGYHLGPFSNDSPKNWVFFPLFPLLVKSLNYITASSLISALIISNFCFLFSLVVFRKLGINYGLTEGQIAFAVFLICLFPTSYFFSAALTESLFFLLTLLCWYSLENNKVISSSFFFALLAATRPTGLLIYPAYLLELIKRKKLFSLAGIFSALFALTGLFLFIWYLFYLTGEPLAFAKNQQAWGRNQSSFLDLLTYLYNNPFHLMESWDFLTLNLLISLLAIIMAIYSLFRKELAFCLYLLIPIAVSLYTGKLLSLSRFVMVLFPIYLTLPLLFRNDQLQRIIIIVSAFLLGIMSVMWGQQITAAMA